MTELKDVFHDKHEHYWELIHQGTELNCELNDLQYSRKCEKCSIYEEDKLLPMKQRGLHCRKLGCGKVAKAYQKLQQNFADQETFNKEYASAVFNYLSPEQPDLIRRRTGEKVTWKDAFGNNFNSLDPELYGTLIALVERDGGKYRLEGTE